MTDLCIRLVESTDRVGLTFLLEEAFKTTTIKSQDQFDQFITTPNLHIFVGVLDGRIVACHSIVIESKLIHDYGKVAHMEDLAVLEEYRRLGLAAEMLKFTKLFCQESGVYKILATCTKDMVAYYSEVVGFKVHEVSLRVDFEL